MPQAISALLSARWIVPVEPEGQVLEYHAIAIQDDRILAILPQDEAMARFSAEACLDFETHVLIPGLVNTHTHASMTLLRGLADDLPLMAWLQDHIWPTETRWVDPEFVRAGTRLAIAEMLRGGTTCVNENYFFPDVQAATYKRHGFRALVGLPVIDFPTAWARTQDEYFEKGLEVHDNWRRNPLVSTCFVPHAPYTVNDAAFERIRMLSDQLDLVVHCHIHETAHENTEAMKQHGSRQLARLDRLGLVNDRLMAVHMTDLTDAEIALCAERGVSVAHCPESNLKLASGFCPTHKLQQAGVNLALGTDGCASNNDLDMFGEMRTAALLAKGVSGDASALDAASTLRMATLGGARAMGLGDRIGSIEPGKLADLTCVDMDPLETQPMYHAISQLVYATGRHQVSDVWIGGVRKLDAGALVDMDVAAIRAKTRQWRERIAGIKVPA